MFLDRSLGDNPAEYNEGIERGLMRIGEMRKLIADLLDVTQIESGKKNRRLAEVEVREIAQRLIENFAPQVAERQITLHLDAPSSVPLQADAGEIEMILSNLISNAIKYNRDGGRVEVRLQKQDKQVVLSVADTGIGMTDDEAAQLFGEFVRIRNEKTLNILGSGLGLSIVKKLAQLYGGDAKVTSAPDKGSTFTVTLNEE
jgi:two-component system, sensor histidine kinase and response regulator